MSYILDALRRADSERERGGVPSVHSKQVPPALADEDEGDTGRPAMRPLGWLAMAGSGLVGAVLAWFFVGRGDPAPEAPSLPPPPVAAAKPVLPPPVTSQPPAAPAIVPPAPAPMPPITAHAQDLKAPPAAKADAKAKPASAAAADTEAEVPGLAQLPDELRRQVPALTVSGATYSKTASSRMLILNGQVLHEGDKVGNDLVLEQIRLKSAVLSVRGQRFSISY
jgi:general secretion pathway protein B